MRNGKRAVVVAWVVVKGGLVTVLPLGLGGCLTERTVTDGSGEVIYQEPEVHMPFESEEKKQEEIEKKERELGWQ